MKLWNILKVFYSLFCPTFISCIKMREVISFCSMLWSSWGLGHYNLFTNVVLVSSSVFTSCLVLVGLVLARPHFFHVLFSVIVTARGQSQRPVAIEIRRLPLTSWISHTISSGRVVKWNLPNADSNNNLLVNLGSRSEPATLNCLLQWGYRQQ